MSHNYIRTLTQKLPYFNWNFHISISMYICHTKLFAHCITYAAVAQQVCSRPNHGQVSNCRFVHVCWRLRRNSVGMRSIWNCPHMLMDTSTHPPTLSLPAQPWFKSHPRPEKKKLKFNTEYSGAPHEHEKDCFSKLQVSVCAVLLEFLQMLSCLNHFS